MTSALAFETISTNVRAATAALAFARVRSNGTVDASRSKGLSSANVSLEMAAFCLRNLPFNFKGAVVTPEYQTGFNNAVGAVFAIGDPVDDCPGAAEATVLPSDDGGGFAQTGFFVAFYN